MVLKVCSLILFFATSASAQVSTPPEEAAAPTSPVVAQAMKLAKSGHMREGNELLKKNFKFDQPGTPPAAIVLHCRVEMKLKNYGESKSASQIGLNSVSLKEEDLGKMSAAEKGLLYCRTEAGVAIYGQNYDSMQPAEREQMKNENLHLIDVLEHANYDAEKTNVLKTRMTAIADRKTWLKRLSATLSVVTWEERPNFFSNTTSQTTKAVNFTPCLGAVYSYANSIYDYSAGLCYGIGHTSVKIDDSNFDGSAKLGLLLGHGKFIRKLTTSGSGIGLQLGFFNRTIDAKYADGTATSANSIGYSASFVGRLSLSKVFFEFKGGTIFGDPSAVWEFGIGVPVW